MKRAKMAEKRKNYVQQFCILITLPCSFFSLCVLTVRTQRQQLMWRHYSFVSTFDQHDDFQFRTEMRVQHSLLAIFSFNSSAISAQTYYVRCSEVVSTGLYHSTVAWSESKWNFHLNEKLSVELQTACASIRTNENNICSNDFASRNV